MPEFIAKRNNFYNNLNKKGAILDYENFSKNYLLAMKLCPKLYWKKGKERN